MSVCPHCQYENLEGALLCDNCGKLLFTSEGGERTTRHLDDVGADESMKAAVKRGTQTLAEGSQLTLTVAGAGKINLIIRDEIVLGRVDDRTAFNPDVDLGPLGGWTGGVSRLHAAIRRVENRVYLVDLASTNGTFLNGERIEPRKEYLLHNGDQLKFGMLDASIQFVS